MTFKTYNGNCLDVLPKLIEEKTHVDWVFTSPPYNRKSNDKYKNYSDNKSGDEYLELLYKFTDYSLKLVGENGFALVNIRAMIDNAPQVYEYMGHYHNMMSNVIIQIINNPQPNTNYDEINKTFSVTNSYEYIFVLNKNRYSLRTFHRYTKNSLMTNVTHNEYSDIHHATMNPKVVQYFLRNFTKEGDTILDPFMGLGTTGIESLKMKRNFIGIELDKQYFDISNKRLNETKSSTANSLDLLLC